MGLLYQDVDRIPGIWKMDEDFQVILIASTTGDESSFIPVHHELSAACYESFSRDTNRLNLEQIQDVVKKSFSFDAYIALKVELCCIAAWNGDLVENSKTVLAVPPDVLIIECPSSSDEGDFIPIDEELCIACKQLFRRNGSRFQLAEIQLVLLTGTMFSAKPYKSMVRSIRTHLVHRLRTDDEFTRSPHGALAQLTTLFLSEGYIWITGNNIWGGTLVYKVEVMSLTGWDY
ncbi:hypothetical protein N7540_005578 [Penicillium herquei]|nr:hypothetical protein N7540_005578 [Penicillium herquei]